MFCSIHSNRIFPLPIEHPSDHFSIDELKNDLIQKGFSAQKNSLEVTLHQIEQFREIFCTHLKRSAITRTNIDTIKNTYNQYHLLNCLQYVFEFGELLTPHLSKAIQNQTLVTEKLSELVKVNRIFCIQNLNFLCLLNEQQLFLLKAYLLEAPDWLNRQIENLVSIMIDTSKINQNEQTLPETRPLKNIFLDNLFGKVKNNPNEATKLLTILLLDPKNFSRHIEKYKFEAPTASMYLFFQEKLNNEKIILSTTQPSFWHIQTNPWLRKTIPNALKTNLENHKNCTRSLSLEPYKPLTRTWIASKLLEQFSINHKKLPHATFGIEVETIGQGLPRDKKNALEEYTDFFKDPFFTLKSDCTIEDQSLLNNGFELSTSEPMSSSNDISVLQNHLAILNEFGFFNHSSCGIHVHLGIRQWNTDTLDLNKLSAQQKNFLNTQNNEGITFIQLMLCKLFTLNFARTQKIFFKVSKDSDYNQRIGRLTPKSHEESKQSFKEFREKILNAKSLIGLQIACAETPDSVSRNHVLNLSYAFKTHKTIEIRGMTKSFGTNMEIDPNMPIRDLIYTQDILRISIDGLKKTLELLPSDLTLNTNNFSEISLKPSIKMKEVTYNYVQDSLKLGVLHAIMQRNPEKRIRSMDTFMNMRYKYKDLFSPETLNKLQPNSIEMRELLQGDPLAMRFLNALCNAPGIWQSRTHTNQVIQRTKSLREMSDQFMEY